MTDALIALARAAHLIQECVLRHGERLRSPTRERGASDLLRGAPNLAEESRRCRGTWKEGRATLPSQHRGGAEG